MWSAAGKFVPSHFYRLKPPITVVLAILDRRGMGVSPYIHALHGPEGIIRMSAFHLE